MIVVDTNVVSEAMTPVPVARVLDWMRAHPRASLFTTTITLSEVLFGLELIPAGKRRVALQRAVEATFDEQFAGRILPFDMEAARASASISARRRKFGRPIDKIDAQIAGIVRSQGAALATRNVRDFENCGIELVNPWD